MTDDAALRAFAEQLRKAPDEKGRQALVKRASLIAMKDAEPEAFKPPISTLGEYLERPIEVPPVLVEPTLLVRGGILVTLGRAGKGKTVMNLNRMLRWSVGKPMFDDFKDADKNNYLRPVKPLRILVIENEGSAGMFHKQLGLMVNAEGYMSKEDTALAKENILIWGEGGFSNLKLDRESDLNNIRAGIEEHKPDIVFLEPFRGLWQGEENSATDMAIVVDALNEIAREYDVAVIIAHHERKSGAGEDGEKMSSGRGSTVLEGAATIMENFESVKNGEYRELSWSKSRYAPSPPPVRMEWDSGSWWYKFIPLEAAEKSVIDALEEQDGEAMTVEDFKEVLEESDPKVRKILKRLVDDGRIKRIKSGGTGYRYRLNTDGEDAGGGLSL